MSFSRLLLTVGAVALSGSALKAQAPSPAELPWNAPRASVRAAFARMGLREVPAQSSDSVLVFTHAAAGSGVLRARFSKGRLWHAFYVAEGDSAALQTDLDRSAAALTARYGQAARGAGDERTWTLPTNRRFALPSAPSRAENGRFTYAVVYHRS